MTMMAAKGGKKTKKQGGGAGLGFAAKADTKAKAKVMAPSFVPESFEVNEVELPSGGDANTMVNTLT